MTMVCERLQDTAIGVDIIRTPENLSILAKPECAAALWQRETPTAFQTWIDALDPNDIPAARHILQPQNVRAVLSDLCDTAGLKNDPNRQQLINDITFLTHRFRDLMEAPYVRLRLDRVTTNACRRFHIDAISARLVCTYRGTGTQYGNSADGAEPTRVFTVPTGSPILMRGTLWPEQPSAGLLHRSPPIEGSGETRLVLVLDPIFSSEESV